MLIKWLVFLHVLSAITFFLAHGTSAAMAFKIRRETDFARIRAMLDLSASTTMAIFISFLALGLTGIALVIYAKLWDKVWVWLSIFLMLFVFGYMSWFNKKGFKELRRLVGLPYMRGRKEFPAEAPASAETVAAHLKAINVHALTMVGYIVPAVVLWLMVFEPF